MERAPRTREAGLDIRSPQFGGVPGYSVMETALCVPGFSWWMLGGGKGEGHGMMGHDHISFSSSLLEASLSKGRWLRA